MDVGTRSEAAILAELIRRGYDVSVPQGVNHRYDLIVDLGGRLLRAQCKTGRLRDGVVQFPTRSTRVNTKRTFVRDYVGQIEIFLVYCPNNKRVYCVPVDECRTVGWLRVEPTANNQASGVRWARDYELPE